MSTEKRISVAEIEQLDSTAELIRYREEFELIINSIKDQIEAELLRIDQDTEWLAKARRALSINRMLQRAVYARLVELDQEYFGDIPCVDSDDDYERLERENVAVKKKLQITTNRLKNVLQAFKNWFEDQEDPLSFEDIMSELDAA